MASCEHLGYRFTRPRLGMDEDTRVRIFDPFFTTKFNGRGLGMAAALGIIRGPGGATAIEPRGGVGTCAGVLLPAASHANDVAPRDPADRGTILIVDDDGGIQAIACRALS